MLLRDDKRLNTDVLTGCILDMDGVVTNTAHLHAEAWKRMFDEFLDLHGREHDEKPQPFDSKWDYLRHVDGKPRYDGVRSFLESRGIALPFGDPGDTPDQVTVCGLGNRKNDYFLDLLAARGVKPYTSTIDFIENGRKAGIRFGLISSSRNARKIVEAAGLSGLFRVIIDGVTADELGLKGKPQPDIFLEAAAGLEVEPGTTVVIEDAVVGIEAGRTAGFGLVIGVDRNEQSAELLKAGADLVIEDLADLSFGPDGSREKPESALVHEKNIIKQLQQGVPAVFLDYDGTLTEIVTDPAKAELHDTVRQTIQQIGEHWFTAVISGRGLDDIRGKVGLDNLVYGGSHGFETTGGGGYFDDHPKRREFLVALDRAEQVLKEYAADKPDIDIERKKFAIAAHYRKAGKDMTADLEKKVDEVAAASARLRKTGGKKIFELRPDVSWDKGKALKAIIERFHVDCSRVIPLYIGDDLTDEDAFRMVKKIGGIGILVSDKVKQTAAEYILRDPRDVAIFLERLAAEIRRQESGADRMLVYEGFEPEEEKLRESLCTLGNGYFASRAAAVESSAGSCHYPGTYIAGCYNRLESGVAGEVIENESIVNIPNWLPLTFRLGNGEWFAVRDLDPVEYIQKLDMEAGLLQKTTRFVDDRQREIFLSESRFVSMSEPHLAGLQLEITVKNWSGKMQIRTGVNGQVANTLVKRYQELNNQHLQQLAAGVSDDGSIFWLQVETNQSHIRIAEACRTRVFMKNVEQQLQRRTLKKPGYIGQEFTLPVEDGATVRLEKMVSLYHSRDRAISESLTEAQQAVAEAPGFSSLLRDHQRAWKHLWRRCRLNIRMSGNRIPRILNLHIFHVLQTVSVHAIDLDVGVPPRALHGEAYRGLIMWDELFVFPFLNLRIPDISRALLHYRYRRLPRARQAARAAGFKGAMFPWQSGSNGREEAQTLHLNPQSGHWLPDNSHLQRHINIAVAYNVWLYYQVSGDLDFISFYGAELIIETARFWASIASYNESAGRYEIKGVMGPDEFHTGYPWADEPGLNNNAYTNVMAVWVLCRALDVLQILPTDRKESLWENLSLDQQELELWDTISRRMRIDFFDDGIISQFQGYERLEEFDWEKYRRRYGNIHRLDRILEAEDDSPNRYRLSKQADVLMLFYLLSADELRQIFKRLGYPFAYETIPKNIDYYLKRTAHGSTLSRVVHAWVLARSRREQSWNLFCDALKSDISDIQGGTTHEGIHLGAMAGTIDLMQRCYTGLETREDVLQFNPALPEEVRELSFNILYRHHWLQVVITGDSLTIDSRGRNHGRIRVAVGDVVRDLMPDRSLEFPLKGRIQDQKKNGTV